MSSRPAAADSAASLEAHRRALLQAYREQGNTAARDELIADLLPLARSVARRYAGRGEQLDDLEQVASVGLIKAVDRFDLERDATLVSYIFPTIVGEVKRHFRDRVWAISVPRPLKDLNQQVSDQLRELTTRLGRTPTIAELAEAVDADEEAVVEALEVGRSFTTESLNRLATSEEGDGVELIDLVPDEERGYMDIENRAILEEGFSALEPRERKILQMRFGYGLSQARIAEEIGVSQMHISRLIRSSLAKLNEVMEQ